MIAGATLKRPGFEFRKDRLFGRRPARHGSFRECLVAAPLWFRARKETDGLSLRHEVGRTNG